MSTTVASAAESGVPRSTFSRQNARLILAGILLHLLAAYFSVGYYSADEHFQILEFAGLKTGLNQPDDLPWEFPTRMRPALQPALAFVGIRTLDAIGVSNPFTQAAVFRFVTTLLSLACMLLLYRAFVHELHSERFRSWFMYLSLLLWFLPFQHARLSSETWSGLAFFAGLAMLVPTLLAPRRRSAAMPHDLLIGCVIGSAFLFRYQAGLLIAPLALWLLLRARPGWRRLTSLAFGALVMLGIGALIDRWFYGEWTLTAWNYLRLNLIDGAAAHFGTHPWWSYFGFVFRHGIFPIGLLIIVAFLMVWIYRAGHVVTWTTLTFIGVHTLIGHKELRFLFPLANIVPFVLVLAAQVVADDERWRSVTCWASRWRRPLMGVLVAVNTAALLFASLKPAEPLVYVFRHVYEQYDPASTALVYADENPYGRVQISAGLYPELPAGLRSQIDAEGEVPLLINFYRHRELPLVRLSNHEEVARYADSSGREVLLAWHKLRLDRGWQSLDATAGYCYLPSWVTRLNVTDWTSRTQIWTLYRVQASDRGSP